MKRYINSTSDIESYKNYKIGQEDSGDQRFYFQYGAGKFCYAPTIEELKSKIDKWIKDKDDSEFITAASDTRSRDRMEDDLDIIVDDLINNATALRRSCSEMTDKGLKEVLTYVESANDRLRRMKRNYVDLGL